MQKIKTSHYDILFSNQSSSFINDIIFKNKYSKVFILVDSNTKKYCLKLFLKKHLSEIKIQLITIKNGEENKTQKACIQYGLRFQNLEVTETVF